MHKESFIVDIDSLETRRMADMAITQGRNSKKLESEQ